MEPQLGRLDEEGGLFDDYGWRMVDGRRGWDRHYGRRPGAHIDADVEIDIGGKGMGYGEDGDDRQAEQNPFHTRSPSVVESQHPEEA
jgi:hypothetical protein